MYNKEPPFDITNRMIQQVAEIAELVGRVSTTAQLSKNPALRRSNRIRTIHGSLAIEQNTLSLEQVTAVLNGRQVLAPPKDIAEVKNAYEIYDHMNLLDPYSTEDLLRAHAVMMRGLVEEAGMFRTRPVGVVDGEGPVLHVGTLPDYVPDNVMKLQAWAASSPVHPLITSCVFHYEFELIHPFADGNGRMGRLWHTLLLSRWNPLFAWLPVESIVHDRQAAYYDAINRCNFAGESTEFIEFMLASITASLTMSDEMSDGMSDEASGKGAADERLAAILHYLAAHEVIGNGAVCELLGVSGATAGRLLKKYTEAGALQRCRHNGHWAYRAVR